MAGLASHCMQPLGFAENLAARSTRRMDYVVAAGASAVIGVDAVRSAVAADGV